jgi:endonuclease/exonuclease/phosphatase family metal-dependent hydrolase
MAWAFGANVRRSAANSYGTAILSRYPIESYRNTPLPAPPGTQQRGLLRATIVVNGVRMSVYGTHLENTSATARLLQARAIAPIVRADPLPKVFGGDLNSRPGSPVLDTIDGVAHDTWAAVGVGAGLTHPDAIPRIRIDYLMYADGSTADLTPLGMDVLPSHVSDHRAVRAAYRLTAGQGDVCVPVLPEQNQ